MYPPERNWLSRFLEAAFIFFLAAYLIRAGVRLIIEVYPVLLAIAAIVLLSVVAWHIWKHIHDAGQW